ncbi:transcriptional regulator [Streptomyces sp. NPDC058001]|uniref:ArsR/SmtB family transcription factor n=1 Tax=Streptomyces sp. NPDC058001 TaxID=3346300 RepID=UPI0036F12EF4
MGWWQITADTLASSRFVLSPLAEATSALIALERGEPSHPGDHTWFTTHRPAYRDRLAADPVTALLIRSALGHSWLADFLTPTPTGIGDPTFHDELAAVRATPPEAARTHLTVSLAGPLPARLHRTDLPERTADLLDWVWTETVLPYWPRRRRILEADVVARIQHLSQGGWAAAIGGMRPGMRWLGESRLQVNAHEYPPRDLTGSQLFFVPVTPPHGWVSWDSGRRHAVVYPCSGALADPLTPTTSAPESLRRLLGPGRAAVLALLDAPKSTTQLVALTGQGLGSVGRHLKVLHDAHLIARRRTGRSVLYYRTPTGETLIHTQPPT